MDMAPDPALTIGSERATPLARADMWTDLADHAAEPNSFYAPDMLIPALEHLAGQGTVRLLEVAMGDRLIGLLPVTHATQHGRLPIATSVNWMHRHCFFGAPIVRRGQEKLAWAGFLQQLDAAPWAQGFLHLSGIDAAGANAAALEATCVLQRRPFREIQRYDRAMLRSDLPADAYWEATVRSKKRKEIRRLQKRLDEMGRVESRLLTDADQLGGWCDAFLALEASGWKGSEGTALRCTPADEAFFREACDRAFAGGRLMMLRLDLDGRPIAMLANFRHGEGAFSFKIAIDETLGRFSPGTLIEIANLHAVLGDPGIAWMDSCAAADHPMIDSLWGERRSIAQYRVALRGNGLSRLTRTASFALANATDRLTALIKDR